MIPAIKRRTGYLMASGELNFVAGTYRDTPVAVVEAPRADDIVLGYIICDHTHCCREHRTHVIPHSRCILR